MIVKLNGVPTVPAAVSGLFVMIGATPAAATVIVSVALPVPVLFVAPSSTAVVPTAVGEPLMTPVAGAMLRPAGSGLAEKLVGDPDAVIVKLNGVPTVPGRVSGLFVMIGATPAAATVMVSVALPVPLLFVAPSRTAVVPAVVGEPLMTPVAGAMLKPAGSGLAEKLVGEPDAVIV